MSRAAILCIRVFTVICIMCSEYKNLNNKIMYIFMAFFIFIITT